MSLLLYILIQRFHQFYNEFYNQIRPCLSCNQVCAHIIRDQNEDKQNLIIKYSINNNNSKMQTNKKSRAQVFPSSQYMLYKSTQLKDPYYVKNRHMITRNSSKGDSLFAKSVSVKHSVNKTFDSFKDNKFSQISMENSSLQYKPIKSKKKMSTQKTLTQSQSRNGHYKIQDLLGLNSRRSKKGSQIIQGSYRQKNVQNIQNVQYFFEYSRQEIVKLRKQNEQLMRVNQQLLYQKQYFKQKVILQEVQIRDLNRKLVDLKQDIFIPKSHSKKKSTLTEQSQLSFKVKQKQQISSHRIQRAIYQIHAKPVPIQNTYENNIKNFDLGLQKSSLLISQSEEDRHPLKDRSSNQNIHIKIEKPNNQIIKTQKQFSELLQSVQNENNQNRKMTLRKMLAIKAMQLKKVKQKA